MKRKRVNKKINTRRAATLVEAMVTVLIFSLITGALYISLQAAQSSWSINQAQIGLQRELRKAMEQMKKELFETASIAINDVPANGVWYPSIRLRRVAGLSLQGTIVWQSNMIQYILGGANLTELHQINSYGPTTDIVAHNIQSVQFRRQLATPDIVEVELIGENTTQRDDFEPYRLNFELQMRN